MYNVAHNDACFLLMLEEYQNSLDIYTQHAYLKIEHLQHTVQMLSLAPKTITSRTANLIRSCALTHHTIAFRITYYPSSIIIHYCIVALFISPVFYCYFIKQVYSSYLGCYKHHDYIHVTSCNPP